MMNRDYPAPTPMTDQELKDYVDGAITAIHTSSGEQTDEALSHLTFLQRQLEIRINAARLMTQSASS